MKKVFAILHEPASYTVDRNREVYDKLGVGYCYMHSTSLAKSEYSSAEESLSHLSFIKLISRLNDILKHNDIIIMNGYTGKIFILLYLLNMRYHRVIGLDSDTQLKVPSNKVKKYFKKLYLTTIFRNKKIFGLPGGSQTHKQLFVHYGMSEDRICLMPMVVNNSKFSSEKKPVQDKFIFLFVGRLIDVKNLPVLLNAFVELFGKTDTVELRIVGSGELEDLLKSQYQQYTNIVFTGAKRGDQLTAEYNNASAFILPSKSEQWGLVVNEAMAAGLPVIVSDRVGAAWDLVDGQDTGFIFKYDDTEDLKEKMLKLVEDKALYSRFSENASNRVNNQWNYDFYTKCLREFIEKASKVK